MLGRVGVIPRKRRSMIVGSYPADVPLENNATRLSGLLFHHHPRVSSTYLWHSHLAIFWRWFSGMRKFTTQYPPILIFRQSIQRHYLHPCLRLSMKINPVYDVIKACDYYMGVFPVTFQFRRSSFLPFPVWQLHLGTLLKSKRIHMKIISSLWVRRQPSFVSYRFVYWVLTMLQIGCLVA